MLSRIYHPAVGFMSGWLSVTVGFAAPTALAAMAFDSYFGGSLFSSAEGDQISRIPVAGFLALLAGTSIHLFSIRWSGRAQLLLTAGKFLLIVTLIVLFLALGERQNVSFNWSAETVHSIFSNSFAVSLLFVTYAYSGWNAVAYIAGEIRNPQRSIPVVLISASLIVMVIYVSVNAAMFAVTPIDTMRGQEEVALIAAKSAFGEQGGRLMGGLIAFGLLSFLGASMWAGPRVAMAVGEDLSALRWFARTNRGGIPVRAVMLQFTIAAILLFTGTFKSILTYIEFAFQITLGLTVLGVIVLRFREPSLDRPYRTFGYPFVPIAFLAMTGFIAIYVFRAALLESTLGLLTLGSGILVYFLLGLRDEKNLIE